jgi:hypothetical protein
VSRKARCLPLAVQGFLRLMMSWSWRTGYCELSLKDLAVRADIAYSTARIYLAILCETDVPGLPGRKWVTVVGKGARRRIYPVNKECDPMHPQEPSADNQHFEAEIHHSPAPTPLIDSRPSGSEREQENVNVGSASRPDLETTIGQLVDLGVLKPIADLPFADATDAEIDAVIEAGPPLQRTKARLERMRRMNALTTDGKVNAPILADVKVQPAAPVKPPTTAPGPVTFEALVKRLKPGASAEDRSAAVWYLANKLEAGLWKSIGFYTLVVNAIVAGQYERQKIHSAFMHAMKSVPTKRGGRFAADIKPYPWPPGGRDRGGGNC